MGRPENAVSGTAGMYASEESDGLIVPKKRANKAGRRRRSPWREAGQPRATPQGTLRTGHSAGMRVVGPTKAYERSSGAPRMWAIRAVRYDPRQEPYEVIPHVRICAGGRPKGRSLPRRLKSEQCSPDEMKGVPVTVWQDPSGSERCVSGLPRPTSIKSRSRLLRLYSFALATIAAIAQ